MKRIVLLLVLLMILPNIVFAQDLSYLGIENEINGNLVYTSIDATFNYPNTNKYVFPVYAVVSDLNFTSNFNSTCFLEKRTYGSDIICGLDSLASDKRTLIINFTSSSLMTQNKSQTVFKNDIFIPSDVSKFFYEVMLPAGSGLPKDESAISPSGYETATDGRRILLFWNRGSLSGGQVFSANIVYEQVSIIQGVLLGPYAQILLIGGLIGVGGLVFYLLRKRSMLQIVMPILKDDEKRIFEAIMKHGKVVHQKLIVRDSNYSKAKVSKVLKSLEQRGLVKLERVGRSNKVHMMKNFPEKEEKVPGNN
jgi:uncharacterized membrane protein